MQTQRIRSIKPLGRKRSLDFRVGHPDHNFYAEGVVVSNSHSSAYAMITAWTLYLKANHPLQFYLALLRMARHEQAPHEVVQQIEQEMRMTGFTLLPPHFIKSSLDFQIEGDADTKSIRFALGIIRGISEKNAEKLELFRAKAGMAANKFEVIQAARNAGLHIGLTCALVQAGCMEGYDDYIDNKGQPYRSRSRLVLECCTFNILTDVEKGYMMDIGADPAVQWDVLKGIKHLNEVAKNPKGKPLLPDRRFGTIQKRYQPHKEIYLQNSRNERLANYWYERTVLGFSFSERIGDIFADHVDGLVTVADAKKLGKDRVCRLIGFVGEPLKSKTKKGNDQLRFDLSDETGTVTVRAFNDRIGLIEEQNGRSAIEGDLVICNVKATGDGTGFFLQQGPDGVCAAIQTCRIYMRLSELRDAKDKEAAAAEKAADAAPAPPTDSPTIEPPLAAAA